MLIDISSNEMKTWVIGNEKTAGDRDFCSMKSYHILDIMLQQNDKIGKEELIEMLRSSALATAAPKL